MFLTTSRAKYVTCHLFPGSTIDSRDIVDGHREKTLSLLWKIIFAFQVSSTISNMANTLSHPQETRLQSRPSPPPHLFGFPLKVEVILDEDQLREEIGFLKRTLRTKQMLASLRANRGIQESTAGRGPAPGPFETGSTKISLLLEWVNAVCDYYNLRVSKTKRVVVDGLGFRSEITLAVKVDGFDVLFKTCITLPFTIHVLGNRWVLSMA